MGRRPFICLCEEYWQCRVDLYANVFVFYFIRVNIDLCIICYHKATYVKRYLFVYTKLCVPGLKAE